MIRLIASTFDTTTSIVNETETTKLGKIVHIDGPNESEWAVTKKQDVLLPSLMAFFNRNPHHLETLLSVIQQRARPKTEEPTISLRVLDWLVTNYSKKYNVFITRHGENNQKQIHIYRSYRNQLKGFSKRQFDPFRRRDRITFCIEHPEQISHDVLSLLDVDLNTKKENTFTTTIGQLNFFRWAITHHIIEYTRQNLQTIEKDMILSPKIRDEEECEEPRKSKTQKTQKTRKKKRRQLSSSVFKGFVRCESNHVISF